MPERPDHLQQPGQPGSTGRPEVHVCQERLAAREVRAIFRETAGIDVSSSTLDRWASKGLISFIRTLGHQRRYCGSEARALAAVMKATETRAIPASPGGPQARPFADGLGGAVTA